MQASSVSKKKKDQIRYSGRFVKESFPDKFEVAPGAHFSKSWTMRNDGETAWPEDVVLIQTNGDELGCNPVALVGPAPLPQKEYEWTVDFVAPEAEGQYLAYFRMTTGDNIRFGHKIWCSILVKKPIIKHDPVAVQMQKQNDEISDSELYEDDDVQMNVDKSGDAPAEIEPKVDLNKSMTPKQVYFAAVECETDAALKNGLANLYELGFVDYQVNRHLLVKYAKDDNPTNTVCEVLLNGALNESTLNALYGNQN